jgi:tetratricopeptide (TPR) repeat protein
MALANISQFIPRLPFDTLALFEASSGLMFLNLDSATFMQSARNFADKTPTPDDGILFSTINHETYHYLQTLATGYQYSYASDVWRMIVDAANVQEHFKPIKRLTEKIKKGLGLKRLMGFQELATLVQQAHTWESGAGKDLSLMAAQFPELAGLFDRKWEKIRAPNADGLSALDLIEGGAIVFQHLLSHGRETLADRLAEAWDTTGETYRRAFDMAQSLCGPRALDMVLPASALALRYEFPEEAYAFFLERLQASASGAEIEAARAIAANPPLIQAAGKYLGTARDVRKSRSGDVVRSAVYDNALDNWEKGAWDFDEVELLCHPGPVQKMDMFAMNLVVKEGPIRSKLGMDELLRRLVCSSLVLRTAKLPRYRREAEQRVVDRVHPIIGSLVDPLSAADEYNQLGLRYLDEGDLDQAEIMMNSAFSIYHRHQHKQGMAREKYNLGLVYVARNKHDRVQKLYRESLVLSEEIEDAELIALASANLGHEYMQVNRLEEAAALIQKALALEERLGLKAGMAIDYANLGKIAFARKEFVQARELLTKSAELYRAVGNGEMADSIEQTIPEIMRAQRQG